MEPNEALAELTRLSTQIDDVAILGETGFVLATNVAAERGEVLAGVATELLAAAARARTSALDITRIEVALATGSVFVVREGGRTAVATTGPEPTAALVTYDLRAALRRLGEQAPPAAPARRTRRKEQDAPDA